MHADHAVRPVRGRGAPAHPAGSTARLAWHQFRYDLHAFFRNRQARFFTLALPVLVLVIFASVFTGTAKVAGGPIDTSVYDVPGIITLAIISAASGNPGPRPGPLLLHT
jgi:ABC-2 type transport system permease protein